MTTRMNLARLFQAPVFWPLFATVVVHIVTWPVVVPAPCNDSPFDKSAHRNPDNQPDADRFFAQAQGIVEGRGPAYDGTIDLTLPPGYPAFLSVFLMVGAPDVLIRLAQVLLSVAGCLLVYASIRPYSQRWACLALWILGTCPWLTQRAGELLSEALGAFLCACLIACYSYAERRSTYWGSFWLGVVAALLPLVSPFAVFLSASLLTCFFLMRLRQARLIGAAVCGSLCIFLPWLAYVAKVTTEGTGGLFAANYVSLAQKTRFSRFARESFICESDMGILWNGRGDDFDLSDIPQRAFSSVAQRRDAQQHVDRYHSGDLSEDGLGNYFEELRCQRLGERGLQIRLVYPFLRAVNLWFDMFWPAKLFRARRPDLPWGRSGGMEWPDVAARGWRSLFHQGGFLKAIYAGGFQIIYASYPVLFLIAVWRAVLARRMTPLAIFAGILLYSAFSSATCLAESRRNVVFFPAMAFTAAYLSRRRGGPENATRRS